VYKQYQAAGISDLTLKLYKDDRHEILNETDRKEIYKDVYAWLCNRVSVDQNEKLF